MNERENFARRPFSQKRDCSAWAVQRDRFRIDDDVRAPAPDTEAVPIGDAILRFCRALETNSDFAVLRAIQDDWLNLAGAALADHAWPARMERQTLTLCVENSIWLNEVSRMHAPRLLRKLRGKLKKIRPVVDAATVKRNAGPKFSMV